MNHCPILGYAASEFDDQPVNLEPILKTAGYHVVRIKNDQELTQALIPQKLDVLVVLANGPSDFVETIRQFSGALPVTIYLYYLHKPNQPFITCDYRIDDCPPGKLVGEINRILHKLPVGKIPSS